MTNTNERSREIADITMEVLRDTGVTSQPHKETRVAAIKEVMRRSGCKLTAATAHVKRALAIMEAERTGEPIRVSKRGGYRRNAGAKKNSKTGIKINVENRPPRGPDRKKIALKRLATNPPVVAPDKQNQCLATILFVDAQFPILIRRETPFVLFCESIDATDKPPGYTFTLEEAQRLALGDKITLYRGRSRDEWRFEGRQPIWRGIAVYNPSE